MSDMNELTESREGLLFESLQDPKQGAGYIGAVLEEGDDASLILALRYVARARGLNKDLADAGIPPEDFDRERDDLMISGMRV